MILALFMLFLTLITKCESTYTGSCICREDEDFNLMISRRKHAQSVQGAWWQAIDDKLGAFAFSRSTGVNSPDIYSCMYILSALPSDKDRIDEVFKTKQFNVARALYALRDKYPNGYVVKPASGFSAVGVFIITKTSVKSVHDLHASHGKRISSVAGVASYMTGMVVNQANSRYHQWQVEELVESRLPEVLEDYKFIMFGGNIAAIDYIQRATSNDCFLTTNEHFNVRYDNGSGVAGCIGRHENVITKLGCSKRYDAKAIRTQRKKDWKSCTAKQMANTVIGMANDPNGNPEAKKLWQSTVDAAKKLGSAIGVHMRVDMMIGSKGPYIGEFTPFHRNGIKDCAVDPTTSPPDPCYLGKQWKKFGWESEMITDMSRLLPNNTLPAVNGISFMDVYRNGEPGVAGWRNKCAGVGVTNDNFVVV